MLWYQKEDSKRELTSYKLLVDLSHHGTGCQLNAYENCQSTEGSVKEINPCVQTQAEELGDKLYSESMEYLHLQMKSDYLKNNSSSPPRASSPNPLILITSAISLPLFASNARVILMLMSVPSSISSNTNATSTANPTTFIDPSTANTSQNASWIQKIFNLMSLLEKLMPLCIYSIKQLRRTPP